MSPAGRELAKRRRLIVAESLAVGDRGAQTSRASKLPCRSRADDHPAAVLAREPDNPGSTSVSAGFAVIPDPDPRQEKGQKTDVEILLKHDSQKKICTVNHPKAKSQEGVTQSTWPEVLIDDIEDG